MQIQSVEKNIIQNIKASLSKHFGIDKSGLDNGVVLKKETLQFLLGKIRKESEFLSNIACLEVGSESGKALNIGFSDPWLKSATPRNATAVQKNETDLFSLKRVKSDHSISIDQIESIGFSERELLRFLEAKMTENETRLVEKHLLQGIAEGGTGASLLKGFLQKLKEQNPRSYKEKSPLEGKILIGEKRKIQDLPAAVDEGSGKVSLAIAAHGLQEGHEFFFADSKYNQKYIAHSDTEENKLVFEATYVADNMNKATLHANAHYTTLDALCSDLKKLIPQRKRRNLKVFVHADLLQERITYLLNKNESMEELKNTRSLDLFLAGMPCIVPQEIPENTVFVADPNAIALYVGKNSGRFAVEEDHENDCLKFFRSFKIDAVLQDKEAIALATNIEIVR